MKTRTIIIATLTSRWLWIPFLVFLGFLQMLPWAFAYGYLGILVSLWWFYPWLIREIIRLDRKLPKSEGYEGGTAGSKEALECYLQLLKVDQEKPHSPSPIQH